MCRALGLLAAKLSHSHPTSSLATANSSPAAEGDASRISLPSSSSPSPSSSSSSSSSFSATSSSSSQAVAVLTEGLRQMLARASAVHRMVASLVIGFWGQCPSELLTLLSSVLTEQITYEEIMPFLVALQRDCHVRWCVCVWWGGGGSEGEGEGERERGRERGRGRGG